MNEARGVVCLWGDLKNHPQCPHGNCRTHTHIEINFFYQKLFISRKLIFYRASITVWYIC